MLDILECIINIYKKKVYPGIIYILLGCYGDDIELRQTTNYSIQVFPVCTFLGYTSRKVKWREFYVHPPCAPYTQ